MSTINVRWAEDMSFDADVDGFSLKLDAAEAVGGKNRGPRPKPFVLVSLGGCTGMDVVSILRKMRVEYDALTIRIDAEMDDEFPKPYTSMKVIYKFTGTDLPKDKLQKAVDLSKDRYCGVSANYKASFPVSHEIQVNGEVI